MLLRMALFFLNYPVRISQKSCRATPEWLPFVTCLGDCDILLFDLNRYEQNNTNYILYGDQEERVENWAYIKGGFQKWID